MSSSALESASNDEHKGKVQRDSSTDPDSDADNLGDFDKRQNVKCSDGNDGSDPTKQQNTDRNKTLIFLILFYVLQLAL